MIDADYYLQTYKGAEPEAGNSLDSLIARAERDINLLTGRNAYDDWQTDAVKTAIASQVEHYVTYGVTLGRGTDAVTSVSIGSYKESYAASSAGDIPRIATMATDLLTSAGLLFRGVGTYSPHWMGDRYNG